MRFAGQDAPFSLYDLTLPSLPGGRFSISSYPLVEHGGRRRGAIVIIRNVTEQARLREELRQNQMRLRSAPSILRSKCRITGLRAVASAGGHAAAGTASFGLAAYAGAAPNVHPAQTARTQIPRIRFIADNLPFPTGPAQGNSPINPSAASRGGCPARLEPI